MTALDTPLRRISTSLIAKFGKSVTLRRVTAGAYNTATGKVTPTTADEAIKALVESYSKREIGGGGAVLRGDLKVSIAATDPNLTAAPAVSDRLVVDAVVYQVIDATSVFSGEQVALYQLQVRR